MQAEKKKFTEWIKILVWFIFMAIIGYLLIASVFSTCYLGDYRYDTMSGVVEINKEHTFYIRDRFLPHIVLFLLFSVLLCICKTDGFKKIFQQKNLGIFICVAAGLLSLFIILEGQYYPKFDQKHIVEAAAALNKGDTSDFDKGGYLFIFPFQTGIILYYQLLERLFGETNYLAMQAVNVLWIVLAYYFFMKISGILWEKRSYELGSAVLCLLFFPYLLYAAFLYGTVIGMAFALFSFYMMLLFEKNEKVSYLLLCGLSMGIATVWKSNYMIFMIAELIYLFLSAISAKGKGFKAVRPKLLLMAAILFCFLLGRFGVNTYIRSLNDGMEVKGIPMTAWVAMGLQDGKAAPGWYNGYNNRVYEENDYDYERTEAAVLDEIRGIVRHYPQDVSASISFFVKKVISQWNNPTFQSLWILDDEQGERWLTQGNGRYLFILWVNLLQTWILTGVFFYAVFRFRKSRLQEILLPMTFVGGFVFHLIWEAEGLYAILYFPLLLPLSICGYGEWRRFLLEKRRKLKEEGWQTEAGKRLKRKIVISAAALVMVCALSYTDAFAKMFARNENTGAFDTYTQDMVDEKDALPGE